MEGELMAVIDIVLAFFVGVIVLMFVLQCIRQIYSRWYCDTQEYYLSHENENGGVDIHWFNQRSLDLDKLSD